MICTFALHPSASKHFIARAVAQLPQVQKAFHHGRVFIGLGTTNALIAENLLACKLDRLEAYTAGVITQKVACATESESRQKPWCIERGKVVNTDWLEFVSNFEQGDIFIKGANALDPFGRVGILIGDQRGGTIGKSIGILKSRGVQIICPVGLEKMIPSCELAEKYMGIHKTGPHLGLRLGYMSLSNTHIMTEIESIRLLFGLEAVQAAAGGVGGMEGAVVLVVESDKGAKLEELIQYVKQVNQQPQIKINKKSCTQCTDPCQFREKAKFD